jgi:hypothetical protein
MLHLEVALTEIVRQLALREPMGQKGQKDKAQVMTTL